MTNYIVALTPCGKATLTRGCDFTNLIREVVTARANAAAQAAVDAGAAGEAEGQRSLGPLAGALASPFDLHAAIIEAGRFAEAAAIVLRAEEDGPHGKTVRDVTEEEARSEAIPASTFARAFTVYVEAAAQLTAAILGFPGAEGPPVAAN